MPQPIITCKRYAEGIKRIKDRMIKQNSPEWKIGDAASAVEEYQENLMEIVKEQSEDSELFPNKKLTELERKLQRALIRLHNAIKED